MSDVDDYAAYALISPTGHLVFRPDAPEQMLQDVAAGGTPPHEFTIISPSTGGPGLHGCITSISQPIAPPNPLAATVIAALGGPEHDQWLGILGISGSKLANPTGAIQLSGLIAAQQRLIQAIHSGARRLARSS